MRIAIIGAGAAGCFCSVVLGRLLPKASIDVFEAGKVPLAKVAITGGGRCNLTNSFAAIGSASDAYPRGTNLMKRLLKSFGWKDTWEWFENEGVPLVLQDDNCVFPQSQDAMQIVRTLTGLMHRQGVKVHTEAKVVKVQQNPAGYSVLYDEFGQKVHEQIFDKVVVTTGGSSKAGMLSFLDSLEIETTRCVPSLFTFNLPLQSITQLSGIVTENVTTSLAGTKLKANGPLLITDWGMSGPAILKLSSYGARLLSEKQYEMDILVNWTGDMTEDMARQMLQQYIAQQPKKQVSSVHPEYLKSRLWEHLLLKAQIKPEQRWAELGSKGINRLASVLTCDTYHIKGRGRFKDEFVTCGGVSLNAISSSTLECKSHPGLYFAGEVLDVDAITGGFNLQAAWTMGYTVAHSIADSEA